MKKFEYISVTTEGDQWGIESESIVDYIFEYSAIDILAEEGIRNDKGDIRKRHLPDIIKECLGEQG